MFFFPAAAATGVSYFAEQSPLDQGAQPAPAELSSARNARNIFIGASVILGLTTTGLVFFFRRRTFVTRTTAMQKIRESESLSRSREERLALAAEAGEIGMWEFEVNTGKVIWNRTMHAIHQTDPDSYVPTFETQQGFVVEEDQAAFEAEFRRCQDSRHPFIQEYRIKDQSGQTREIKTRANFLGEPKGPALRAVGTLIDISDVKAAAAAKEAAAADKAKTEFLALMSHEIRTSLNGVLGFTSLLRETLLNPEQLGYLETMDESGNRLIHLVNNILDLTKIEAGAIHIEPVTFAVRPYLQQLHEQFQTMAGEKKLLYELWVDESVPEALHTDPHPLSQILTNLLSNAVKFTKQGHVRLRMRIEPAEDQWEWHFTVEDTGPGIAPELLPHLFQAFYQGDGSSVSRKGSTGLGLVITRRFAKKLNGHLEISSEVDEGSAFSFVFSGPRVELPQTTADPAPDPTVHLAGKRILVVEDNVVSRKLCALQLQRFHCQVEFAETGLSAVVQAATGDFDAILMDVQLPDIDGHDAAKRIRAIENRESHVPIIAITANAMEEDRQRCLEAGMDDFLSKPLKLEVLAKTLARWVGPK